MIASRASCWQTELLDAYTQNAGENATVGESVSPQSAPSDPNTIGFRDASFEWAVEASDGMATPSNRKFMLHLEDELVFKRGSINLVVGPTGSGKTSLLMALLGMWCAECCFHALICLQVRCTSHRQLQGVGITCQGVTDVHSLLRSHGCRTKQSVWVE